MVTLFIYENNIYEWNRNLPSTMARNIEYGDPIVLEYKKFRIVSQHFNRCMRDRVMIICNLRDIQTKEKAMDSIVYYDDDAKVKKLGKKKYFDIENFDPSKYGNPVCYYNPAYEKDVISMVTRIHEVDDPIAETILKCIGKIFSIGGKVTARPIFSIAGNIIEGIGVLTDEVIDHMKPLSENHVIVFRMDDIHKPFLAGRYLCLPNVNDDNEAKKIMKQYYIYENNLVRLDEFGEMKEYEDTYFILEVSNNKRDDLLDFNFTATSNELLKSLELGEETGYTTFLKNNKDAFNFNQMKSILRDYKKEDIPWDRIRAKYQHLHSKEWFDQFFPEIAEKLKSNEINFGY